MIGRKMKLRFIGEDGSMGLTRGETYEVKLSFWHPYFWVEWRWNGIPPISNLACNRCPYISIQAFANNWELPHFKRKGITP